MTCNVFTGMLNRTQSLCNWLHVTARNNLLFSSVDRVKNAMSPLMHVTVDVFSGTWDVKLYSINHSTDDNT